MSDSRRGSPFMTLGRVAWKLDDGRHRPVKVLVNTETLRIYFIREPQSVRPLGSDRGYTYAEVMELIDAGRVSVSRDIIKPLLTVPWIQHTHFMRSWPSFQELEEMADVANEVREEVGTTQRPEDEVFSEVSAEPIKHVSDLDGQPSGKSNRPMFGSVGVVAAVLAFVAGAIYGNLELADRSRWETFDSARGIGRAEAACQSLGALSGFPDDDVLEDFARIAVWQGGISPESFDEVFGRGINERFYAEFAYAIEMGLTSPGFVAPSESGEVSSIEVAERLRPLREDVVDLYLGREYWGSDSRAWLDELTAACINLRMQERLVEVNATPPQDSRLTPSTSEGEPEAGLSPSDDPFFPSPPVESWWVQYRSGGQEAACEAVVSWTGLPAKRDCLDEEWPIYFFHQWSGKQHWDLYSAAEKQLVQADLVEGIASLRELLETTEGDLGRDFFAPALEQHLEDLDWVAAHLDSP